MFTNVNATAPEIRGGVSLFSGAQHYGDIIQLRYDMSAGDTEARPASLDEWALMREMVTALIRRSISF